MTKEQIIKAVRLLPKLDRDAILEVIVECNAVENFLISPEQQKELDQRLAEIDNNEVELIEGQQVMDKLASKFGH